MSDKCKLIKFLMVIFVGLLVFLSYQNIKLMKENNAHLRQLTDLMDELILETP